jgi:hypothetical protein
MIHIYIAKIWDASIQDGCRSASPYPISIRYVITDGLINATTYEYESANCSGTPTKVGVLTNALCFPGTGETITYNFIDITSGTISSSSSSSSSSSTGGIFSGVSHTTTVGGSIIATIVISIAMMFVNW